MDRESVGRFRFDELWIARSGLWRHCRGLQTFPDTIFAREVTCRKYDSAARGFTGSLRSAQAFSVIAVLLLGFGAIWSVLLELRMILQAVFRIQAPSAHADTLQKVAQLGPRVLFSAAAISMGLAGFAFLPFAYGEDIPKGRSDFPVRFGGGYAIVWLSVVVSVVAAVIAHFHHNDIMTVPTQKSPDASEPTQITGGNVPGNDSGAVASPSVVPVASPVSIPVAMPVQPPVSLPMDEPKKQPLTSPVKSPRKSPVAPPRKSSMEPPKKLPITPPKKAPKPLPNATQASNGNA
ncbi:uncharacterized protein LOC135829445 isoform X2 [Sycon ciliatum]